MVLRYKEYLLHFVKSIRMNGLKLFVSLSVLHSILYCINAQEVNECNSIPCKYGGTCSDLVNAFTCACTNGYSGTNCQVASLGSSCSQSGTVCADPNASCQSNGQEGSTCQCTSLYYDSGGTNNIGGTCTSRRNLGGYCSGGHTNNRQCIDQSASCRGFPYICSCDVRFHSEGSKCIPNVALHAQCTGNVDDECSDPNAECLNSECTCGVGFYMFKSNSLSNCRDVKELRVTGITFSSIKTTEFTVSWTAPTRFSYVSGYDVEWQIGGKIIGASSPQWIRGLTPGKVYELKVISKDTATQPGMTRTTYTLKQQASKPSIPGAVTSSVNDLDALDGNILIKWTAGTGAATKYRIKMFDNEVQKGSKETSSLYSWFSGVLNGHIYSIVIMARSEQFNGKYLWSVERVAQIKTKVQVPEAPNNAVCKSTTDSTITLDWDAPTLPNGDIVRYHIEVVDASSKLIFIDEGTGSETQKVVGNLQPGTSYIFRLYTENELYNSTSYDQVSSACITRAKMTDPPTRLTITEVTSRGFDISWEKPNNTYSEENYGYVLQIKDDEGSCWKEVIYRCLDCNGRIILSDLLDLCDSSRREQIVDKSKLDLAKKLVYNATLYPDITYIVTVTAINDVGRGHPASFTQRTKEEAPQTPYDVKVVHKNATSLELTWNIDGPRPGKTDFLIALISDPPALSKNYTTSGFDVRGYTAYRLQEYWNYRVFVKASTSVGSSKSAVTNQFRTNAAAPGKVSEFKIEYHPDGDYTKMRISWKMPTVLERNGIIRSYKFEHFATWMVTSTKIFNQEAEGNTYTVTIDVKPEKMYNFTVFAINEDGMDGEKRSEEVIAPAGVSINIEKTQNISIIPVDKTKNVGETKITVSFVQEFFMEETYGAIKGTGLIICSKKDCAAKTDVKKLNDFNSMKNWKEDKEAYRPTNQTWLTDTIKNNIKGRSKRSLTYLEYTVGSENCPELTWGQYCNGPLQTGKSYYIFAVSCTNGGCLVSEANGPFITKAVTDGWNCSTQSVVIGVVLGLIILILLVYAGYTTITIRRMRAKYGENIIKSNRNRHISQTYVNETFGTGMSGVLNDRNVEHPGIVAGYTETEYSTLDNDYREDKATYDILKP